MGRAVLGSLAWFRCCEGIVTAADTGFYQRDMYDSLRRAPTRFPFWTGAMGSIVGAFGRDGGRV